MDRTEYFNDMIYRLEELLYHELSGMAAWKVEFVGTDFIQSKEIKGDNEEEIVKNTIKEIVNAGLVKEMSYAIGGKGVLLRLTMEECIHLPKEIKLKKDKIEPFVCPMTYMVLDQLIEKLGYETTYLADLDIDENTGKCTATCAIYETPEKIGLVCDWSEEAGE
jgi:hypothetical protein